MDNEEWPFERLDIVEVAMNKYEVAVNNYEVAMNNDNNQFRKIITNSANKGEYNTTDDKLNIQLLSILKMKTKDDLGIGHIIFFKIICKK